MKLEELRYTIRGLTTFYNVWQPSFVEDMNADKIVSSPSAITRHYPSPQFCYLLPLRSRPVISTHVNPVLGTLYD